MKSIIAFLIIFSLSIPLYAMDTVDSLQSVLKSLPEDTNKVNTLLLLSKNLAGSNPNEAINVGLDAKILAEKLNFYSGLAYANKRIGIGYYMQGKYLETLNYWDKSLEQFRKIKDQTGEANILNNIGSVYFDQTDETRALENYLLSLKI